MKTALQIGLRTFMILGLLTISFYIIGQENRAFDGKGNNLQNPEWGAVGTNQLRLITNGFSDKISVPSGKNRPNPRFISNAIFNQDGVLPDAMELSDVAWVWGQFIDHDVTLVEDDEHESYDISVPASDPYFDPHGSGSVVIGMKRSAYDPLSGTGSANPRAFPNSITAFIDASTVYGSDETKANWLRTFENGKLKMSIGNLLPYNTLTGEYDDPIDPNAPSMAMPLPFHTRWFVAGDIRANENPLLTSFHTIFAREHNRLCSVLATQNPSMSDEELYQQARKIVGGLIQTIVYEEWLPSLGVHLDPYVGYDQTLKVGIMNVFSAAAYRYGHTVINSTIIRMDNDGNIIPEGNMLLRDAFFNPTSIIETGGIEPYIKGMTTQIEQDFDCKMIHDLRNFLFGPPGAGGLDLASININRGRERGLPDYNTIRTDIGLDRVENFNALTNNSWLNQVLENVYGDIDDIDPWVGFLAEDHMSSALFGKSVMTIMEHQFTMLRDGDRFYYENDNGLSQEIKEEIKNTRFVDIIYRNSNTANLQENVFLTERSSSVANVEESTFDLEVYPNPVSGDFFINIAAIQSGEGIISITDMLGKLVVAEKKHLMAGMNTLQFNLNKNLPEGIYNVTLAMNNKIGHQKIFKK